MRTRLHAATLGLCLALSSGVLQASELDNATLARVSVSVSTMRCADANTQSVSPTRLLKRTKRWLPDPDVSTQPGYRPLEKRYQAPVPGDKAAILVDGPAAALILVTVTETGAVDDAMIVCTTDVNFGKLAERASKASTFQPATLKELPVHGIALVPYLLPGP